MFGEELSAKVQSLANEGLQNIDSNFTRPEKKNADTLHSIVAKLIWVSKRGRTKIELDILFL